MPLSNVARLTRDARFVGVVHAIVFVFSLGVAVDVVAQEIAPTRPSPETPNTPERETAVSPPPGKLSSPAQEPRPRPEEPGRRLRRASSSERSGEQSDDRKFDRTPAESERWKRNRERWREMKPEERAGMRRLHRLLRDLPEERRRQLVERFRHLNPDDRRALLDQLERFRTRAPDEQVRYERRHQALRGFLRELPDAERERVLALEPDARARELRAIVERMMRRFYNSLPTEEQRRLDALPAADREAELRRKFLATRQKQSPPAAVTPPETGRAPHGEGDHPRRSSQGVRGGRGGDRLGEPGPPPPGGWGGPPPSEHPGGSRLRAELEQLGRLRDQLEELPPDLRQALLADPTITIAHPKLTAELRESVTRLTPQQRGRLLHLWRSRERRGPPSGRPNAGPDGCPDDRRPGEPLQPTPTAARTGSAQDVHSTAAREI